MMTKFSTKKKKKKRKSNNEEMLKIEIVNKRMVFTWKENENEGLTFRRP